MPRKPPSAARQPVSGLGAVNQIQQGDCLMIMPTMPAGLVATTFVDSPYNINFSYDSYDDKRTATDYLAWCRQWLTEVRRLLAADGTLWLAIGPRFVSELDVLCKELGFHKRSQVVWTYTFGTANTRNFALAHTYLLYYTVHRTKFHFDPDIVRVPSARQLVYGDKRANPKGKLPDDVWFLRPQDIPGGLPAGGDLWHCPRVAGTFGSRHDVPTHMPEQVVARCLRITTPPGGLVFDPMAGSGTTPAVAKKLGFRYAAIELSEKYAAIAQERVASIQEGDSLAIPQIQD